MPSLIDLSTVAAPDILEALSYEDIVAQMKAAAVEAMPELGPVLALEGEPAVKVIEVCAAFVLLTRARVNDAARATMLAYATGTDLENLAALYGVQRLVTDPGDPEAVPPVPPTYETDSALRYRTQMAPEGFSVAGPKAAYAFHALSADGSVRDVAVASPSPGDVVVTILSDDGAGTASPELIATVSAALNHDTVRPLCDTVSVQSASIVTFTIDAELEFFEGPDTGSVLAKAQTALAQYLVESHRIGRAVRISGIHAALHQPGVQRVILTSPTADVETTAMQAPYCTAVSVTAA